MVSLCELSLVLRQQLSRVSHDKVLDGCSVEALSDALDAWGDEVGAIVVVSHDRQFCDKIDFTHVATVQEGSFRIEERSTRASDWVVEDLGAAANTADDNDGTQNLESPSPPPEIDPQKRKQAYNAPKRIAKLEQLIEQAESRISEIDSEMMSVGSDVGSLVDLNKNKEALQKKVDAYVAEWEELESLLALVS